MYSKIHIYSNVEGDFEGGGKQKTIRTNRESSFTKKHQLESAVNKELGKRLPAAELLTSASKGVLYGLVKKGPMLSCPITL